MNQNGGNLTVLKTVSCSQSGMITLYSFERGRFWRQTFESKRHHNDATFIGTRSLDWRMKQRKARFIL